MECYIKIKVVRTAFVPDVVPLGRRLHDVPFDILVVFTQVCAPFDYPAGVVDVLQIQSVAERPGSGWWVGVTNKRTG
jgi:hypothetical protein